jgi:uncharacterized membrane protein
MKHFITLCLLGFSWAIHAQSKLEMYNNTGDKIYAAYAAWDNSNQCWTSHGWYTIEPYKSLTLDFGLYTGKVYIHGHTNSGSWGSGYTFCVDDVAFAIRNADKIDCTTRKKFSEATLSTGTKKWTFNP